MGIIDGLMKGIASASFVSIITWIATPSSARIPASLLMGFSVFLIYTRFWIQGYLMDKTYQRKIDVTMATFVVTGGTYGGLGFAAAELLASMGASIILTCRTKAKANDAVMRLQMSAGHNRIKYVLVDFMSQSSVTAGAAKIATQVNKIDGLVLNAGIASGSKVKGGDAAVWMTNYLGPFIFTQELIPLLQAAAMKSGTRVVAVSSGAHKGAAINWNDPFRDVTHQPTDTGNIFGGSYAQSKLAQIMHMRELQRRLRAGPGMGGDSRVKCFAITPGAVWTKIFSPPLPLWPLMWCLMRSPSTGAQVIKMACIDPDIPGGSYLSNCCVKPSEGVGGCSNDEAQWVRLWELSEKQRKINRFQ